MKNKKIITMIVIVVFILMGVIIINMKTEKDIFYRKIKNIKSVSVQNMVNTTALSNKKVNKLKKIILSNYNKNNYNLTKVDLKENQSRFSPIILHVKVDNERLYIGYLHKKKKMFFNNLWISSSEKDSNSKGILLKTNGEVAKLLKDIGIKINPNIFED